MTTLPPYIPVMSQYRRWLGETRNLTFADYEAMRQWSVTDLDAFWQSIWDYFDLQSPTPHTAVLADRRMPGAVWFPSASVNYARQVLRHVAPAEAAGVPAIISAGEDGVLHETRWRDLQRKSAALALHLRAQGVTKGDRVAAYLPNIPETIVAFLATASIGAEISRPRTRPSFPTCSARRIVVAPQPQPTSITTSPRRGCAAWITASATGARTMSQIAWRFTQCCPPTPFQ